MVVTIRIEIGERPDPSNREFSIAQVLKFHRNLTARRRGHVNEIVQWTRAVSFPCSQMRLMAIDEDEIRAHIVLTTADFFDLDRDRLVGCNAKRVADG